MIPFIESTERISRPGPRRVEFLSIACHHPASPHPRTTESKMVVTDSLVYIHMPKTGGTFVTEVLLRLHEGPQQAELSLARRVRNRLSRLGLPTGRSNRYGPVINLEPKHGTCQDLPEAHRDTPVFSTMRSPYDWYVSQYEFGWWKRTFEYPPGEHPTPVGHAIEQQLPAFQASHPHFPDISFEEFVTLCDRSAAVYNSDALTEVGLYSHGFLRYYYHSVPEVAARISPEFMISGRHKQYAFDVHFLFMERLNQELHDYLLTSGYRKEDIAFVLKLNKILPMDRGRREDQRWQKYYSPALKRFVREREWMLFEMFPEYDA